MYARLLTLCVVVCMLCCGCFRFRTPDADAAEKFAAKGTALSIHDYADGKGHTIHYAQSGNSNGPTLFFVHGSPGAWNAFEVYMQDAELAKQFRMISIDRPGFGYSNFGKAMGVREQSEIFNALIRSINNGQSVTLIGHSLGGPVIAQMAALDTLLASRLIILAGSFKPSSDFAGDARGLLYYPPFRWLAPGAFRPSNDELFWFRTSILSMPAVLSKITCTVWFIHGKKDTMVPYADSEFAMQFLQHSANAYMVTYLNENHFIPWTRFADIKSILLRDTSMLKQVNTNY